MDDFCRELGVALSTAYKWSAAGSCSGKFPRFKKFPNGSIRIRRDGFDEWLDSLDTGRFFDEGQERRRPLKGRGPKARRTVPIPAGTT